MIDELNKFVMNICFGDEDIALDLIVDFISHFEKLLKSIQNIQKNDLAIALHNLSGSAGLMELITISQEIKKLELLLEIENSVPREKFYSELHNIKVNQITPLLTKLKGE